jgi:hypothetical protein
MQRRRHDMPITPHCLRPAACSPRARGAAMTEMVLVLPLILFVLAMMIFFGRGMVRVQHALVMDRYATWRAVYNAPGPRWQLQPGTTAYNQAFFAGNAAEISRWLDDEFPKDAEEEVIVQMSQAGPDAEALILEVYNVLPGGLTTGFSTTHTNTVPIYDRFDGPVRHRHTRAGNDWKFTNSFRDIEGRSWRDFRNDPRPPRDFPPTDAAMGQWQPWLSHGVWWPGGLPVSLLLALREGLYDDLDSALERIQNNDNPLAGELRELFVREPGYGGATVYWTSE